MGVTQQNKQNKLSAYLLFKKYAKIPFMKEITDLIEKRAENFKLLKSQENNIVLAADMVLSALKNGNKIFFCGNGGSASDSNHLAAEFISKFKLERKSLPAISLCANNSIITAIANDYDFEKIFSRQIEGLGKSNDILIGISTSGKSKNVLNAFEQAKKQGLKTIFLTGQNKSNAFVDLEINAPSEITAEIQEMHIAIGHIIAELVEKELSDTLT